MHIQKLRWLLLAVLAVGLAAACGDDDDDGGTTDAGTDGAVSGTMVMCGDKECFGGNNVVACCADSPEANTCGLSFENFTAIGFNPICHGVGHPGEPDTSCPAKSLAISGMTVEFPGCCRPDGQCGFIIDQPDLNLPDLGCAPWNLFAEPPSVGDADAGIADAGAEDAGAEDAGAEDAGAEDAGAEDAGVSDAGTAPAPTCTPAS